MKSIPVSPSKSTEFDLTINGNNSTIVPSSPNARRTHRKLSLS